MADDKKAQVPVTQLKKALGIEKLGEFRNAWAELSDKDKADIRQGVGDGTMNY